MMKRIIGVLLCVCVLFSLSACGGTGQALPKLEIPEDWATEDVAFPDDLDGLCGFMANGKAIAGDPVEMSYEVIGAKAGVRYRFTYNGSTVQVELYEFDPDNLDEAGKACLDSVQEEGSFTVLDKEVPALCSGKYLMVYTDNSKDEKNTAQRERVEKLFLDFEGA